MSLNCRPGDLAYVVRALVPSNVGMVVEVLNEWCDHEGQFCWLTRSVSNAATIWYHDGELVGIGSSKTAFVADANLRPIRDNDGEDESLTWAPSPPEKVLA